MTKADDSVVSSWLCGQSKIPQPNAGVTHIEHLVRENTVPDCFLGVPVNDIALGRRFISASAGPV